MTLLEKSGIVWSHTGLETFQRRNCKGLWERNTGCILHSQNSHHLKNQKIVLLTPLHTPPLCSLLDVRLEMVFSVFPREILCAYGDPVSKESILNCFIRILQWCNCYTLNGLLLWGSFVVFLPHKKKGGEGFTFVHSPSFCLNPLVYVFFFFFFSLNLVLLSLSCWS